MQAALVLCGVSMRCLPALMCDETHRGFPTKDTLSVLEFRVFNEGFMIDGPPTGWNLVSKFTDTVWPKTPP